MNKLLKVLSLGAVLGASAPLALAATITGQVTLTGNDSFNATTVSFGAPGSVGTSTIAGISAGNTVNLISGFNYTPQTYSAPLQIFSITNSGTTLAYFLNTVTVGSETAIPIPGIGTLTNLNIIGSGFFTETGYQNTTASFDFSSQAGLSNTISFSNTSFATGLASAPEISASGAVDGVVLLSGCILILRGRRRLFSNDMAEAL